MLSFRSTGSGVGCAGVVRSVRLGPGGALLPSTTGAGDGVDTNSRGVDISLGWGGRASMAAA